MSNRYSEMTILINKVMHDYKDLQNNKLLLTKKQIKKQEKQIHKYFKAERRRIRKQHSIKEYMQQRAKQPEED